MNIVETTIETHFLIEELSLKYLCSEFKTKIYTI